jgi:hypothetical protein
MKALWHIKVLCEEQKHLSTVKYCDMRSDFTIA